MRDKKGKKATNFKGGRIIGAGYVLLYVPRHPNCDNKGYVREHRLVMERTIGRYLLPDEIVHHLDYDRSNNEPSNLALTDASEHMTKYHPRSKDSTGKFI